MTLDVEPDRVHGPDVRLRPRPRPTMRNGDQNGCNERDQSPWAPSAGDPSYFPQNWHVGIHGYSVFTAGPKVNVKHQAIAGSLVPSREDTAGQVGSTSARWIALHGIPMSAGMANPEYVPRFLYWYTYLEGAHDRDAGALQLITDVIFTCGIPH